MKLNKSQKQAFIRAVLDDTPQVNYQEQIEKLVTETIIPKLLPDCLKAAYADKKIRESWFETSYYWPTVKQDNYHITANSLCIKAPKGVQELLNNDKQLKSLVIKLDQQNTSRHAIREKLEALLAACSTRKQILEALPEFEKYLPSEPERIKSLPAVAGLVTDLMQAGWPKDKAA